MIRYRRYGRNFWGRPPEAPAPRAPAPDWGGMGGPEAPPDWRTIEESEALPPSEVMMPEPAEPRRRRPRPRVVSPVRKGRRRVFVRHKYGPTLDSLARRLQKAIGYWKAAYKIYRREKIRRHEAQKIADLLDHAGDIFKNDIVKIHGISKDFLQVVQKWDVL